MSSSRSIRSIAPILVLGITLLTLATPAAAATFLVDDDGVQCPTRTHSTIQAAVNAAAASGDTIDVCEGTYPELVTVNKSVILQGAQAGVDARSVRTGLPATESVVTGNAGTTSFYVTASNVTIDGFTVQGQTNANQFGAAIVLAAGTSGADVLNNIVQDNVVGLFLANNPAGGGLVVQRNLFRNNNIPGPAGSAIYTDEFVGGPAVTNVLIDNNDFLNNTEGIVLSSGTPGTQTGFTMSNNNFDLNFRAFFLFNLEDSTITLNTLSGATGATSADIRIFGGVHGLSITCNTLENGAGRAIRINDGNGDGNTNSTITINDNNISGYANNGLEVNSGGYTGGVGSLNAESNWWGSATGPTIASNPGGTGEEIVDPDGVVDYTPFETAPVTDCGPPPVPAASTITLIVLGLGFLALLAYGLPRPRSWEA